LDANVPIVFDFQFDGGFIRYFVPPLVDDGEGGE
jgi:hypothetical protein